MLFKWFEDGFFQNIVSVLGIFHTDRIQTICVDLEICKGKDCLVQLPKTTSNILLGGMGRGDLKDDNHVPSVLLLLLLFSFDFCTLVISGLASVNAICFGKKNGKKESKSNITSPR